MSTIQFDATHYDGYEPMSGHVAEGLDEAGIKAAIMTEFGLSVDAADIDIDGDRWSVPAWTDDEADDEADEDLEADTDEELEDEGFRAVKRDDGRWAVVFKDDCGWRGPYASDVFPTAVDAANDADGEWVIDTKDAAAEFIKHIG